MLSFTLVCLPFPLNYSLRFIFIYLFDRDSTQILSCTRVSYKQIYISAVPGQERQMAQLLVDNVVAVTRF